MTQYHAKFWAHELTKRCRTDSVEKLAGALVDAKVDLNPHQVEAALFAFRSPLSKGALLADEVGLGKTIEAGMVLSQKWAERKRKILVITPANLRKQWHQELGEKFFLPCRIFETKSYNQALRDGAVRPFENFDAVTICSYQFARAKAPEISFIEWDLVVFDEAHRLRNVYKPSNVIANTLKNALKDRDKILLTATPLQNSLLELFGLVSIIDDHVFGDLQSFREQFANLGDQATFEVLKARIKPICHRTLRRQVSAYVSFTARHPILEEFTPEEAEDRLYNLVSEYLQRENLQALPRSQRSLMTLVLRKLLASSTFAIAGALDTLTRRLKAQLRAQEPPETLEEELDKDYESLDETAEEWPDDPPEPMSDADKAALAQEIKDLEAFRNLASSITTNAKGQALLTALERAFAETDRLGAARKAIIFTESRKTQSYLQRVLAESPHAGQIVLFNGSNTDPESRAVYEAWLERHRGTDGVTGSRSADMRAALVEEFEKRATIMIATEAGAEGINLQFCALVVNYDLPWNPQRIEQRIGRCHRYGQKHDVVVVNFLNRNNEADQRVFQLLDQKFKLFQGVFGSSDEVLGSIESGVDFEKRIATIYQQCRTREQIKASFDELQRELSAQIDAAMTDTRQLLLEHFDDEVHEKLRIKKTQTDAYLDRYQQMLLDLTRQELNGCATFVRNSAFVLDANPFPEVRDIPLGLYELPRNSDEAHVYRMAHPLATAIVQRAKDRSLSPIELTLDCSGTRPVVTALQPYIGSTGEAAVTLLTVESLDQAEDHLLVGAITDGASAPMEEETAQKLFKLRVMGSGEIGAIEVSPILTQWFADRQAQIREIVAQRNAELFDEESSKLEGWADDLKLALEREIKELDRRIKEAKRAAKSAIGLEEKLERQKQVRGLEQQRSSKRRSLFEAYDDVDRKREAMIDDLEKKLQRKETRQTVLGFRWKLV